MARSRKKTPKTGITSAASEKEEKQVNHRRERRRVRQVLAVEPEPEVLPHSKELSNPWSMAKDGKGFLGTRASWKDLKKWASCSTISLTVAAADGRSAVARRAAAFN